MFNQVLNIGVTPWRWQSTAETCSRKHCIFIHILYVQLGCFMIRSISFREMTTPKYNLPYFEFQHLKVCYHAWMFYPAGSLHRLLTNHARCCVCCLCRRTNPTVINIVSISVTAWHSAMYRVIHKSLRNFQTRLRNNQDRHSRKEHINR